MQTLAALPGIAREAIAADLEGRAPALPKPDGPLATARPVFVTLRIDGQLRGCIGSLEPMHRDLVTETADRARAAAFEDRRFPPLHANELELCRIEVSVLSPLEPVADQDDLDPQRFGVIVADAAGRRGVLLPAIPGVDTAAQQLDIAGRKAGIPPGEPVRVWRFTVEKVEETC